MATAPATEMCGSEREVVQREPFAFERLGELAVLTPPPNETVPRRAVDDHVGRQRRPG